MVRRCASIHVKHIFFDIKTHCCVSYYSKICSENLCFCIQQTDKSRRQTERKQNDSPAEKENGMTGRTQMKEEITKIYTVKDIEALPEGKRAELIDGRMYEMASPSRVHQRLLGALYRVIANYIEERNASCEVYLAPFAVYINNDEYNYVEPDIVVICSEDKLDEKGCHGAPDWAIEIVSPSSVKMDRKIKLFKYRTAGVREYWIVDPAEKMVEVHLFTRDEVKTYTFQDTVSAGIYEDFAIDFSAYLKFFKTP